MNTYIPVTLCITTVARTPLAPLTVAFWLKKCSPFYDIIFAFLISSIDVEMVFPTVGRIHAKFISGVFITVALGPFIPCFREFRAYFFTISGLYTPFYNDIHMITW